MTTTNERLINGRRAIDAAGGVSKVSKSMGYEDAVENDGQPREGRLRQVVRLLR